PEALAYARDLALNCSPAAMATIKSQVYGHATVDLETARRESDRLMAASLAGPDFKEGVPSFVDKRLPAFAPLGEGTTFDRSARPRRTTPRKEPSMTEQSGPTIRVTENGPYLVDGLEVRDASAEVLDAPDRY